MRESSLVAEMVREAEPGTVFLAADFEEAGTSESVRKALSRLAASGELERPLRGLYRKPRFSTFLNRSVPASPDEIAEALARKFEWRIAPYGDTALNRLGLDTQVPSVVCYVSDGPYRTYEYGSYVIEFRHTANRDLSRLSAMSATVVQALKALGKNEITDAKLDAIATRLSTEQVEELEAQTRNATSWVRAAVKVIRERRT